jgi:hypothetical protein
MPHASRQHQPLQSRERDLPGSTRQTARKMLRIGSLTLSAGPSLLACGFIDGDPADSVSHDRRPLARGGGQDGREMDCFEAAAKICICPRSSYPSSGQVRTGYGDRRLWYAAGLACKRRERGAQRFLVRGLLLSRGRPCGTKNCCGCMAWIAERLPCTDGLGV